MSLKKCVVITGVSSGLGEALAEIFHQNDWFVVGVSRNRPAKGIFCLASERTRHYSVDLSERPDISALKRKFTDEVSRIDLLVNNAACADYRAFSNDGDTMARTISVNLTAAILLSQYCAQRMLSVGEGVIAFVSSLTAVVPHPDLLAYGTAKAGLEAFHFGLMSKFHKTGVRSMLFRPGPMRTEFFRRNGMPDPGPAFTDMSSPHAVAGLFFSAYRRERGEFTVAADRWRTAIAKLSPRQWRAQKYKIFYPET